MSNTVVEVHLRDYYLGNYFYCLTINSSNNC